MKPKIEGHSTEITCKCLHLRPRTQKTNNPVNAEDCVDNSQEKGTFRPKNRLKKWKIKITIDRIENNNVIIEM